MTDAVEPASSEAAAQASRISDPVARPDHYIAANGLEAIDVREAFFHDNAWLDQVFKYIARAGKKGPALEDLCKARVYLNREIAREMGGSDVPEDDSFFVQHMDQPKQPRVWESVWYVPTGVVVRDVEGDLWQWGGDFGLRLDVGDGWDPGSVYKNAEDAAWVDDFAPFTEILENDE